MATEIDLLGDYHRKRRMDELYMRGLPRTPENGEIWIDPEDTFSGAWVWSSGSQRWVEAINPTGEQMARARDLRKDMDETAIGEHTVRRSLTNDADWECSVCGSVTGDLALMEEVDCIAT